MRIRLAGLFVALSVGSASGVKPSIIMIIADDMGDETVGANGCEDYKTPNVHKMTSSGMRFTNPICTPSGVKRIPIITKCQMRSPSRLAWSSDKVP